jgi:hypothetical protein
MAYPAHLPIVLISMLDSVEDRPDRRRRRASGTQTAQTGHGLTNPETTTQVGRGRPYLRPSFRGFGRKRVAPKRAT